MNMGVPDFITLEGPLYANALVTAERARDERTGESAVVLRTQAVTAACLEQARNVLLRLHALELPPIGLPSVVDWGEDVGGSYLVLGRLAKEPAAEHLRRIPILSETMLLAIAQIHMGILSTLHALGCSGLRPSLWEVWWEEGFDKFSFLGWEWTTEGMALATGDIRAAVGLWIELGADERPSRRMSLQVGSRAWLSLSLWTRTLLLDVWRGRSLSLADELTRNIAQLSQNIRMQPNEQLGNGRGLLLEDPWTAIMWLDLACRANSPPVGSEAVYRTAQEAISGSLTALVEQAKHDLLLGQYRSADQSLQRAEGIPNLAAVQRLSIHRWQAIARGLLEAVAGNTSSLGVPARQLEDPLVGVVDLADAGEIEAASQALDTVLAVLPASIKLSALLVLRADFAAWELWQRAERAEQLGNWEEQARLLEKVEVTQSRVSYRADWAAAVGDPVEALRFARNRSQRLTEAAELASQARSQLARGDPFLAAFLARKATEASRDWPDKYLDHFRLFQRAALRAEAVRCGVTSGPAELALQHREFALTALSRLVRSFPDDVWGKQQVKRWQDGLLDELSVDAQNSAAQLLVAYWPRNKAVRSQLSVVAERFLTDWTRALDTCCSSEGQRSQDGSAQAEGIRRLLAEMRLAEQWVQTTRYTSVLQELISKAESRLRGMTTQLQPKGNKRMGVSASKSEQSKSQGKDDAKAIEDEIVVRLDCMHLRKDDHVRLLAERVLELLRQDEFAQARQFVEELEGTSPSLTDSQRVCMQTLREYAAECEIRRVRALKEIVYKALNRDSARISPGESQQVDRALRSLKVLLPERDVYNDLQARWQYHQTAKKKETGDV